jgi:hypothetical protein
LQGRDWTPEPDDIDDLKNIYFDYIRAGFGTQPPRDIGNPAKGQGFFSHQNLWKEFVSKHSEKVGTINDHEKTLEVLKEERPNENIDNLIKSRDSDWKSKTENLLKENLHKTKRDLEDANEENAPMELLQRAKKTLKAINTDNDEFNGSILETVKEINSLLWEFQQIIKKKGK